MTSDILTSSRNCSVVHPFELGLDLPLITGKMKMEMAQGEVSGVFDSLGGDIIQMEEDEE